MRLAMARSRYTWRGAPGRGTHMRLRRDRSVQICTSVWLHCHQIMIVYRCLGVSLVLFRYYAIVDSYVIGYLATIALTCLNDLTVQRSNERVFDIKILMRNNLILNSKYVPWYMNV
jgi:hypothetical protein